MRARASFAIALLLFVSLTVFAGDGAVVAVVIFVLCMGLTLGLRRMMKRDTVQY